MLEEFLDTIKHKVHVLDRSKGLTAQPYVLIKPGHNVFVRAQSAKTQMEKLRIVYREFIICEQFLSGTIHKPIASRSSGVFKLPHLVYEAWIEDQAPHKHPQEYVTMILPAGSVIPSSTINELLQQDASGVY